MPSNVLYFYYLNYSTHYLFTAWLTMPRSVYACYSTEKELELMEMEELRADEHNDGDLDLDLGSRDELLVKVNETIKHQ